MKIYNTLTKTKQDFKPLQEGKLSMYVCGPTVYNLIHIGNARPMIVFDTFRRFMEYKGYDVNYVSNFTDVDDKIIKAANEEGVDSSVISERYIEECKKDMQGLNVKAATTHPKATQEIDGMIDMIQTLIDKGYAYVAADGTVYYRTRQFKEYGKLSHKNLDDLQSGQRALLVTGEDQKEDPLDFVLWKPKKEGEPYWESPWCQGRPGWHIECSVMSKRYLGDTIDIHAGGEDLIFPHHENEIAQSEAANGVPFAHYWMHNAFLNIDNKKMSKSLGNFFTVRDISEKYDLQVLRFFMLSAHYRSPLNFSAELMEAAKSSLERIKTCASSLKYILDVKSSQASENGNEKDIADDASVQSGGTVPAQIEETSPTQNGETAPDTENNTSSGIIKEADSFRVRFDEAMEDDCNTADAISVVFDLVKFINGYLKEDQNITVYKSLYDELMQLCDVLGLIVEEKQVLLDDEIEALIAERQQARKDRNFARADEIRDTLKEKGIILEDTREGVKWKREN